MKPSSYFTCEINDGESIIILEDCYFKYVHKWIKGGRGSCKLYPYLISIELMYKNKPYLGVSIDKINIIDQYIYENGKRNSILEFLVNRYQEIKELIGEYHNDLPFPISKIDVYED
jgi:hypothetical protein